MGMWSSLSMEGIWGTDSRQTKSHAVMVWIIRVSVSARMSVGAARNSAERWLADVCGMSVSPFPRAIFGFDRESAVIRRPWKGPGGIDSVTFAGCLKWRQCVVRFFCATSFYIWRMQFRVLLPFELAQLDWFRRGARHMWHRTTKPVQMRSKFVRQTQQV